LGEEPSGRGSVAIKTLRENLVGQTPAGKVYSELTGKAEQSGLPYGLLCRAL
jgi:hypothetical protein